MNKDEFEGKWKQVRGQARQWWGKLTDDDVERVGGKFEQFSGVMQEKYGFTREAASDEFDKRMAQFESTQKHEKNGVNTPNQDIVEGKWKQMRGQARQWWGKLTDDDLDKVAGKAEAITGMLQAKYGFSRAQAESEFNHRVTEYETHEKESNFTK